MAESGKDRFDTLTDEELADHVASGHVDPEAGQAELDRRARVAAGMEAEEGGIPTVTDLLSAGAEAPNPSDTGK